MMYWIIGLIMGLTAGVLIGLCLGYWRLAQWYQQRTGRNLWDECRKHQQN